MAYVVDEEDESCVSALTFVSAEASLAPGSRAGAAAATCRKRERSTPVKPRPASTPGAQGRGLQEGHLHINSQETGGLASAFRFMEKFVATAEQSKRQALGGGDGFCWQDSCLALLSYARIAFGAVEVAHQLFDCLLLQRLHSGLDGLEHKTHVFQKVWKVTASLSDVCGPRTLRYIPSSRAMEQPSWLQSLCFTIRVRQ